MGKVYTGGGISGKVNVNEASEVEVRSYWTWKEHSEEW